MKGVEFKVIDYGSPAYKASLVLSEDILRKPLGLSFSPQDFARDESYVHLAGFVEGDLVCSLVLIPQGQVCQMRRVGVCERLQGEGIGSTLLSFCEAYARAHAFKEIYCNARSTAVFFYQRQGYLIEGTPFEMSGIPHIRMRKHLV